MSSNNDAKKFKASSRGKPYSVYWKTSETHSRSSKTAGPMKPVKGVKEGHKHNTKENIKAVANQGSDRPTLRELCPLDKQRVRKLIEQLAEAGSERQRIEGEMKEERKQFGELLGKLRNQYQKVVKEKNQLHDELHSSQLHLQSLHTVPANHGTESVSSFNTVQISSSQELTPKLLNVESILSMPSGGPLPGSLSTSVNPSQPVCVQSSIHPRKLMEASHPLVYHTGERMPANQQGFPHALLPQRSTVPPSRVDASVGPLETGKSLTSSVMSSTIGSTPLPVGSTESNTSLASPRMGAYVQAQYPNYFPPLSSQLGPSHSHNHHQVPHVTQHLPSQRTPSILNHQQLTTSRREESTAHNSMLIPPKDPSILQSSLSVTDSTLNTSQFHVPQSTVHSTQRNKVVVSAVQVPPQNSLPVSSVSNCDKAIPLQNNTEDEAHIHSHSTGDQSFSVRSWKSLPFASPDKKSSARNTSTHREHGNLSIVQKDVCTQTLHVETVATQTLEDHDLKDGDETRASNEHQGAPENTNFLAEKSLNTTASLSVSDLQQLPHQTEQQRGSHQNVSTVSDLQQLPHQTEQQRGSHQKVSTVSDLQQLPHQTEQQRGSHQKVSTDNHKQLEPLPSSACTSAGKTTHTNQTTERSFVPSTTVSVNYPPAPVLSESDGLLEELVTSALLNAQGTLFSLQTLSKLHGSVFQTSSLMKNSSVGKIAHGHGEDQKYKEMRSPSPLELAESLNSHPHTLSLLSSTKSHDITAVEGRPHKKFHSRHQEESEQKYHRTHQNDDQTRLHVHELFTVDSEEDSEAMWTSASSPQSASSSHSDDSELLEDLFFI